MIWFVWEMIATGKWTPVLYHDEPPGKSSAGSHTPKRRGLVMIKAVEHGMPPNLLALNYPLDLLDGKG